MHLEIVFAAQIGPNSASIRHFHPFQHFVTINKQGVSLTSSGRQLWHFSGSPILLPSSPKTSTLSPLSSPHRRHTSGGGGVGGGDGDGGGGGVAGAAGVCASMSEAGSGGGGFSRLSSSAIFECAKALCRVAEESRRTGRVE